MRRVTSVQLPAVLLLLSLAHQTAPAEEAAGGTVRGRILHHETGGPVHGVTVLIVQLGRVTDSGPDGTFVFSQVPTGKYDVVTHAAALADARQQVEIANGSDVSLEFRMRVAAIRNEITVTASGSAVTTFEAFQAVRTMDAIDLAARAHTSIGEVVDGQAGVAKRSFGPGNTRPVVRGFDGDRVLVMVDGMPGGSLGSQSGDHGENIDVLQLERVEVVKGPATLLYGSNAIGGVVNAVTGHHQIQEHAHEGLTGYVTAVGGTTNGQASGNMGLEYGTKRWMAWGGVGGQRTGDYNTPVGAVENSHTGSGGGHGGFGLFGEKAYLRFGYNYDRRRYGIPAGAHEHEEEGEEAPHYEDEGTHLQLYRHNVRLTGGFQHLNSAISGIRTVFDYNRYRHGEYDDGVLGTDFRNREFGYRVAFDQRRVGRFSGNFGFSGLHRDYQALGDESLSPPTAQRNFALFALETVDFERLSLQAGARFEHTGYTPEADSERARPQRGFNGASAAAGVRVPTWKQGAFVANYTHSFRAPALEELYNYGPHPGNLAFEIGNPNLERERADGIDLALRHQSDRLRLELNWFYYGIKDFVFLAPTGNTVEGLFEADFRQGDSRFTGSEVDVNVGLNEYLWFRTGLDYVDAKLTSSGLHLPRIPPLRARTGLEFRYKNFVVGPEAMLVRSQGRVFLNESRTPGYALFNIEASYTLAQSHYVHVFAVDTFNLGDRLYYNHLSFIKDLAPEIGRGVRFSYTVRFF